MIYAIAEGLEVGSDTGTPVWSGYVSPFRFTGAIVEVVLGTAGAEYVDPEAEDRIAQLCPVTPHGCRTPPTAARTGHERRRVTTIRSKRSRIRLASSVPVSPSTMATITPTSVSATYTVPLRNGSSTAFGLPALAV